MWYQVFSGDLLQVAESHFIHKNETYVQRVILPTHSPTFTLTFRLFAELGLEIFLRFSNPLHSYDWFYTFNSADIMSRHPFPDLEYLTGENYFPINGGLIIENQNSHLAFFPDFPLGAGMPDQEHFELHLHRNPDKSDDLGISGYYGEYSPVEHHFLVGFTELEPAEIWKRYLANKASPQVFFKGVGTGFTEDIEEAEKVVDRWEHECEYSLVNEDMCAYVSSVVKSEESLVARVMNLCEATISPEFSAFRIVGELNTVGGNIEERKRAKASGDLEFAINDNSERNFIQYPENDEDGMIKPFHLNTYEIKRT